MEINKLIMNNFRRSDPGTQVRPRNPKRSAIFSTSSPATPWRCAMMSATPTSPGEVFPVLEAFAGKMATAHVHDNLGSQDQHLPLGLGNIPWSEVCQKLTLAGYDHCLACESRPSGDMTWEDAIRLSLKTFTKATKIVVWPLRESLF